jgi:phosphate acetyltransferase
MQVLDRAFDIAREKNYKIVFPENNDNRIIEAANFIMKEKLAEIIWLDDCEVTSDHITSILKLRPNIKKSIAEKLIKKPLYFAGSILSTGQADVLVAGASNSSKRVIEAASFTVGVSPKVNNISSYFLMLSPDNREYIFSDCAVNAFIDEEILKDIAINASRVAEKLLGYSKIALLSFSTLASGDGDSVKMVRTVYEILKAQGYNVFGPIQGDAAVVNKIAKTKGIDYDGNLNVFIFPSLDAGNISYKLCQSLGNFKSYGPFLQGFNKPVCDLSRGATTDDIISSSVLTLASI